jgi:hypothetical protein
MAPALACPASATLSDVDHAGRALAFGKDMSCETEGLGTSMDDDIGKRMTGRNGDKEQTQWRGLCVVLRQSNESTTISVIQYLQTRIFYATAYKTTLYADAGYKPLVGQNSYLVIYIPSGYLSSTSARDTDMNLRFAAKPSAFRNACLEVGSQTLQRPRPPACKDFPASTTL